MGNVHESITYDLKEFAGWAKNKSQDDLDDYHALKNAASIDGLAGVPGRVTAD